MSFKKIFPKHSLIFKLLTILLVAKDYSALFCSYSKKKKKKTSSVYSDLDTVFETSIFSSNFCFLLHEIPLLNISITENTSEKNDCFYKSSPT